MDDTSLGERNKTKRKGKAAGEECQFVWELFIGSVVAESGGTGVS